MKSMILIIVVLIVLCISSLAGAAPTEFWVYDNGDGSVNLSLYGGAPQGGTLQYSTTGGSSWSTFSGPTAVTILLPQGKTNQLVEFRLSVGDKYFTSGDVTFGGPDNLTTPNGLWHSATLNFYDDSHTWLAFIVGTASEYDHVGPAHTPIPAAAWLLGSGLLGLVGVRRVRKA